MTQRRMRSGDNGATAGSLLLGLDVPKPVPTGRVLWVDQVNGNDTTAVRGDLRFPFLTLSAAKTASVFGDTIVVLPGS